MRTKTPSPDAALPPAPTATEIISRYDGKWSDPGRPAGYQSSVALKDNRLVPAELEGKFESFTSDLLKLNKDDASTVLNSLTPDSRRLLAARLQLEAVRLVKDGQSGSQNGEQLKKVTQLLEDRTLVCHSVDKNGEGFLTQLKLPKPDPDCLNKTATAYVNRLRRTAFVTATFGSVDGLKVDDRIVSSLDTPEMARKLSMTALPAVLEPVRPPITAGAALDRPELTKAVDRSLERSLREFCSYRERYEQGLARIAEAVAGADGEAGTIQRTKAVAVANGLISRDEAKDIRIDLLGVTNDAAPTGVAFRINRGNQTVVFAVCPGSAEIARLDSEKIKQQTFVEATAGKDGNWALNHPHGGVTLEFAARQNGAELVRRRTADFINNGSAQIEAAAPLAANTSPAEYIKQLRGAADPAAASAQLKTKLAAAEREAGECDSDRTTPKALRAVASAALCRTLLQALDQRGKEADHLSKRWEEKLASHPEWRYAEFRQIPARAVNLASGESRMLPIFSAQLENGKNVVVDLNDGGVYTGQSRKDALQALVDGNRYPHGYIKYSADNGATVSTARSYGTVDVVFDGAEKAAAVIGLSALGAAAVPSPDPATKGYAAVAGTTSMVISGASNGRRVIGDLRHERSTDVLDWVGAGAPMLGAGGSLLRSGRPMLSALRTAAVAGSLAADGYGTIESTRRLHAALDLDNPNLTQAERAERTQLFMEQTAVNIGLTLFANRAAINRGIDHSFNTAGKLDARLRTAIDETIAGGRALIDGFNPPPALAVAGNGRYLSGGAAAEATGPYRFMSSAAGLADAPTAGLGQTIGKGSPPVQPSKSQDDEYAPEKGKFLKIEQLVPGKSYFSESLGWVEFVGMADGAPKFRVYDVPAGRQQFAPPSEVRLHLDGKEHRLTKQADAGFLIEEKGREKGITFERAAVWFGIGEMHNQFFGAKQSPRDKAVYEKLNALFKDLSPNEDLAGFLKRAKTGFVDGPMKVNDIDLAQIFLVSVKEATGVDYVKVGVAQQTAGNTRGNWTTFDGVNRPAALFEGKFSGGKSDLPLEEYFKEGLWDAGVKVFDGVHPSKIDMTAKKSGQIYSAMDYYPEKARKGLDPKEAAASSAIDEFKHNPTEQNANRFVNQTIGGINEFLAANSELLSGKKIIIVPVPGSGDKPGAADVFAKSLGKQLGYAVRSNFSNDPLIEIFEQVGLKGGHSLRQIGAQKSKGGPVGRMRNAGSRYDVSEDLSDCAVLLIDDVMTTGVTTTMLQERLMPAPVLTITLGKTAKRP